MGIFKDDGQGRYEMIRAINVLPGDRVSVKNGDRVTTRTVVSVGDTYVVIHMNNSIAKVPEHRITSLIKGEDGTIGRRYGV
jgi:hypothetical protein